MLSDELLRSLHTKLRSEGSTRCSNTSVSFTGKREHHDKTALALQDNPVCELQEGQTTGSRSYTHSRADWDSEAPHDQESETRDKAGRDRRMDPNVARKPTRINSLDGAHRVTKWPSAYHLLPR